ncbi:MAG: response regulator [Candidatus Eremiobacteraeota bacterium]|nr:response regulator [Candidatus Eremiobacteraeota bacterium]
MSLPVQDTTDINRRLRRTCLSGFALLFLAGLVGLAFEQRVLESARHDSALIRLASRQRALSESVVRQVLDAAQTDQDQLGQSLVQWRQGQTALEQGSSEMGLPAPALSPSAQSFLSVAGAEMARLETAAQNGEAGVLRRALPRYLSAQDQLVHQLTADASERVTRLKALQWWLFAVMLLVLYGEWRWVFRPAIEGIGQAMSDHLHRQQLLEVALKQAEASSEAKSRVLGNFSHEMLTPLNGILGMGSDLLDTHLDEEQANKVRDLLSCADDLQRLICGSMSLNFVREGKVQMCCEDFSLEACLRDVLSTYHEEAARCSVKLCLEISSNVPTTVRGDQNMVKQTLNHLVSNALKFGPGAPVFVRIEKRPNGIRFSVKDEGPGIELTDAARIFEPFIQLDDSSTRRHQGVGLGLALARDLVELMGGKLEVSSQKNQGATFFFDLPLEATAASDPVERRFAGHVLVVDDNVMNQRVAAGLLKKLGLQVSLARDGQEAIDQVAAHPDLQMILMDCHMPVMDGHEATRILRAQGFARPIVAVSASSPEQEQHKCWDSGMNGYLPKPLRRPMLEEMLTCYLPAS